MWPGYIPQGKTITNTKGLEPEVSYKHLAVLEEEGIKNASIRKIRKRVSLQSNGDSENRAECHEQNWGHKLTRHVYSHKTIPILLIGPSPW